MPLFRRRTDPTPPPTPLWRRYVRFLRPDVDADVEDELRSHLEMCAADLERRGHSREEAEQLARQRFGEVGAVRTWLTHHDRQRQRREERTDVMDALAQDLRFALRALRRSPSFVLAAVLCLGIGLGANAMVFAILDGMLLRPPPFMDVDRLVVVGRANRATGDDMNTVALPYLLDLRARSRTVTPLAAYAAGTMSLDGPQGSDPITAARVSAEFFAVLGARPLLGRGFLPEESAPGAPRVAVLSDALWRERYAADSSIIGRAITLDGHPTAVVGIMPARVGITGDRERLWVPLEHRSNEAERGSHYLFTIGRLAPGATLDGARRELEAIGRDLERAHPDVDAGVVPQVTRFRDTLPREFSIAFGAMFGAVGFVLLIACANVASLLLARSSGRARELAVRAALGATRGRIMRLVVLEAVLIAMAGGMLGLLLAHAGIAAVLSAVPVAYPAWITFEVDARVIVYALLLALGAGTLLGLVPALRATRPSLAPTLRDGGRGAAGGYAGGRRLRNGLVTSQLTLTVVLLAGAGLMVKSVLKLQATDPGFDPRGVLAVQVFAPGARYEPPAARLALLASTRERLATLPGVAAVTTASIAPLSGGWSSANFVAEGREVQPGREPWAHQRRVGDGYFALLRYPLGAGREFTATDAGDPAAAVVVVNETLARRSWPGTSALGRRLSFGRGADTRWLTVVGVARDAQIVGLERRPESVIFLPQAIFIERRPNFLLRTAGDPGALVPAVRAALRELDPTLTLVEAQAMPAVARQSLWRPRLFGRLFGTFAGAALVLALVGVYGVVAYTVAERTHELGVRLALGARSSDVYRLLLGGSARLALLGLSLGAMLALALTQVLAAVLPNVSPRDPVVLLVVVASLAVATLAASWLPARRATRLDPVASLRAN